ncbi:MAG TPA: family 1 glycosylhydrolase [Hanamia sp.]
MNWGVYPESIYYILKKFSAYESIPPLIIIENGAAFSDEVKNGEVNDPKRLNYLKDNIAQVLRAKQEGVNTTGYFVWTFLDNFEWTEGYYPRFGLIYVDFETQDALQNHQVIGMPVFFIVKTLKRLNDRLHRNQKVEFCN